MASPLLLAERLQHQVMGRGERLPERFPGSFLYMETQGELLQRGIVPLGCSAVGPGTFFPLQLTAPGFANSLVTATSFCQGIS